VRAQENKAAAAKALKEKGAGDDVIAAALTEIGEFVDDDGDGVKELLQTGVTVGVFNSRSHTCHPAQKPRNWRFYVYAILIENWVVYPDDDPKVKAHEEKHAEDNRKAVEETNDQAEPEDHYHEGPGDDPGTKDTDEGKATSEAIKAKEAALTERAKKSADKKRDDLHRKEGRGNR